MSANRPTTIQPHHGQPTGHRAHGRTRHPQPDRVADQLERTAQHLREHGQQAVHLARLISTPGAIDAPVDRTLARLATLMHDTWNNAAQLADLITHVARLAEDQDEPEVEDGCLSCVRNGGHWEPRAVGHYRDLCRFCGDWKGSTGDLPPLAVIRARHRGERITRAFLRQHGLA